MLNLRQNKSNFYFYKLKRICIFWLVKLININKRENNMKKILVTLLFLLFGTVANADCNIKSGSINILANDFPALRTLVETAKECKGSADFKVTHSAEHNKIAVPALTANPSEFSVRVAANSSIVPLMNADLIRPMNDLV